MIDYDKYGYCALCHENLLVTISSEGKQTVRLSGKADCMDVLLNDGSRMRVTICSPCKQSYKHEEQSNKLMKSVIKGWEKECDMLIADQSKPDWTPEKKEEYMNNYSKKEIVS